MTNKFTVWIIFTALLFVTRSACASPEMSLSVSGEEEITQGLKQPLLLLATVSDRSSANQVMQSAQNKRLLDAYKATPEYAALSKDEKKKLESEYAVAKKAKPFNFGKKNSNLASQFRFKVTTLKGEPIDLKIRPLESSNKAKGPYPVGSNGTVLLYFGADAQSLAAIGEGDFVIEASSDKLKSSAVRLHLKNTKNKLTPEQAEANLRAEGTFYRLDENWSELESLAERFIAQFPQSPDGHRYKGDFHLAKGNRKEAKAAYIKALELAYQRLPKDDKKGPSEAPLYLIRKLQEL